MIKSLEDKILLNNGTSIPGMGMGVFQIPNEDTAKVVEEGIKKGYRLIDTAQIYGNEEGTGLGIKAGLKATGLSREDLFITSKVWNDHLTYDETIEAFNTSLAKLDLEYLDLYLIHWPGKDSFKDTWLALETLYNEGKIKAIGVSNFTIDHLKELDSFSTIKPVLNQIELHPMLDQHEVREYAKANDIKIQAWSPLAQGQLFDNETLKELAKKYNKSVAQIIFRWDIQQDILLLSKTVNPDRMVSNSEIFDFELTDEDMKMIATINKDLRVGPNPTEYNFEL